MESFFLTIIFLEWTIFPGIQSRGLKRWNMSTPQVQKEPKEPKDPQSLMRVEWHQISTTYLMTKFLIPPESPNTKNINHALRILWNNWLIKTKMECQIMDCLAVSWASVKIVKDKRVTTYSECPLVTISLINLTILSLAMQQIAVILLMTKVKTEITQNKKIYSSRIKLVKIYQFLT